MITTPLTSWEVKKVNANKTQETDENQLGHDYFSASQAEVLFVVKCCIADSHLNLKA